MTETADRSLPPTSGVERAVAWILMLALLVGSVIAGFMGLFLGMISDGCGSGGAGCDTDQLGWGVALAALGSPAVAVATLVWFVWRNVRRQRIWWVPLLGAVLVMAMWVLGLFVAATSVNT